MIVANSMEALEREGGDAIAGSVASIGNFDGVHVGHRALLDRMRALAERAGRPSIVITFFPPAKVLFGDATYLTSPEEKVELLADFGPVAIAMIPFTHAFAATEKDEFISQVARLHPHTIVVGEDFRFGRDRRGGLADLRPIAERLEVFGLESLDDEVVKSSQIRSLLEAGDIERANALLGRPYRARGVVARGQQRGASIGFPTANVVVPPQKALPEGVFAVRVRREYPTGSTARQRAAGQRVATYGGMANVGARPSFAEAPPSLEVHLFDFEGDLYDRTLTVEFCASLREKRTFSGLAELKEQLAADATAARKALADA